MKVLLWENIASLGKRGEVVNVANGYARNYLLPNKYASKPTPQSMKDLEMQKKRLEKLDALKIEEAKQIAERISDLSCTIEVNANEDGALYGAVTQAQVAEALKPSGYEIENKNIIINEPIKELGVFTVSVLLEKDIQADLKVWVVEKSEEE